MFKLIRGGKVFSPDNLGIKDVLIVKDTIFSVEDRIPPEATPGNYKEFTRRVSPGRPPCRETGIPSDPSGCEREALKKFRI